MADADPEALRAVHDELRRLVGKLAAPDEPAEQWPLQGALIINLRNILDAMSEVAVANPMGNPRSRWPVYAPGPRRGISGGRGSAGG